MLSLKIINRIANHFFNIKIPGAYGLGIGDEGINGYLS